MVATPTTNATGHLAAATQCSMQHDRAAKLGAAGMQKQQQKVINSTLKNLDCKWASTTFCIYKERSVGARHDVCTAVTVPEAYIYSVGCA